MGRNIRTQRLLTCLFSIRLFLELGLLPLANRVSTRHYNVLVLNRLQYSLGFIVAPLSPGKVADSRPPGSGVVTLGVDRGRGRLVGGRTGRN